MDELTAAPQEAAPDLSHILTEARDRAQQAWEHDAENRREALLDLAFIAGKQWPEQARREREEAQRPCIVENFLPQYIRQVTNDVRQNTPSIKTMPRGGDVAEELSEIYDGLLNQIQYQSGARHVFVGAAEHQAMCGIGHFRVDTRYTDDDTFEQDIYVKGIHSALAVLWDPAAVEPDRSDAMWCVIAEPIPVAKFRELYPDHTADGFSMPSSGQTGNFWWPSVNTVMRAEYWRKVPVKKEIVRLADGRVIDAEALAEFGPQPPQVVARRVVDTVRVEQYILSGSAVLSGPNPWAGKFIPIVPVIGAEIPVENGTVRHGLIRFARDPQQMHNFWRSSVAELLMQAPKAPWLLTQAMIGPYKEIWNTANVKNLPYLPYVPDPQAPPGATPQRIAPPPMPAALVQEGQLTVDAIKATVGMYDASLGARGNEVSGKAIMARQREGDTGTYHFVDNLSRSLEYCGRILIDLIPKIYDTQRMIRIIGDDDQHKFVAINRHMMDVDGTPVLLNDLSAGRFDVRVKIGPSYTTKRQEAAESMTSFMQVVPAAGAVIGDLVAKNMDWPGAEQIAERLKRSLPPNILGPEDAAKGKDGKPIPPPPPDPMIERMKGFDVAERGAAVAKAEAEADTAMLNNLILRQQIGLPPPPPSPAAQPAMPPPPAEGPDPMQGGGPPPMPNGQMPDGMGMPPPDLPPGPADAPPPGMMQ